MNLFETINKYKKYFEAVNLFDFVVNVKSTLFRVAYYKLGFIKGYLVLYENGTVCPRDKALDPFKMVIQLNSFMHGFYTHGLAETQKPTYAFQETIELGEDVKPLICDYKEELESIISDINQLEQGFKRLKQIYSDADETYKEIMSSKELNQEKLNKIVKYTNEFSILQYQHLQTQLAFKKPLLLVITELRNNKRQTANIDKRTYKKALDIFKHLSSEGFQTRIKKSLKDFETNSEGFTTDFYSMPNWEQKLIINSENNNRKIFNEKLLAKLRN